MFSAIAMFAAALLFFIAHLMYLHPSMERGEVYLASNGAGVLFGAWIVVTPLAFIAASISFIWQDLMPKGWIYHYSLSAGLAFPGVAFFLVITTLSAFNN